MCCFVFIALIDHIESLNKAGSAAIVHAVSISHISAGIFVSIKR